MYKCKGCERRCDEDDLNLYERYQRCQGKLDAYADAIEIARTANDVDGISYLLRLRLMELT